MKEENKPKLLFWLCAVQFVISSIVLGMNTPARMFVRQHSDPDEHLDGTFTQRRRFADSGFLLHLWPVEMACCSGLIGILVFLALLITVCRIGWTRLIRKIRNPTSLTSKECHLMRHVPARMVFFHPRVIISFCLWTNLLFAAAACITVYVSNGISDHVDTIGSGARFLGEFDIEVYLCEVLPWMLGDDSQVALMMTHERCMLAQSARWMLLFSALFSFFQFFLCVWVVDSISRPLSSAGEKRKVRQWQNQRAKLGYPERAASTAIEDVPEVSRVAGKL
ncbi:hypothetical protein SLS54_000568 [Diplodia seriata]